MRTRQQRTCCLDDSFTTSVGHTLHVTGAGVLANDTDSLTGTLVNGVQHGTLTFNADGSFDCPAYTGFHCVDGFDYKANDGTADNGLAPVTINTTNGAPVAADHSYSASPDIALTVTAGNGLLAGATDADGDALTAALDSHGNAPQHGAIVVNIDGAFSTHPIAGIMVRTALTI